MNTSNYNALMAELRTEYLESFDEKFIKLKDFYAKQEWYNIELEYHKLKGTGTTYGIPEVSELCQQLERICQDQKKIPETLLLDSIDLLSKIRSKYINKVEFNLSLDPQFQKICKTQ
jgi:HPt (histidine-containing phosphotransfer) domain-containing protein